MLIAADKEMPGEKRFMLLAEYCMNCSSALLTI
jgi:hypothetical protein